MEIQNKKKWLGTLPEKCDICGIILTTVFIDGRTIHGPWANMCSKCHKEYGCGTGTGYGQKYDINTTKKIEG